VDELASDDAKSDVWIVANIVVAVRSDFEDHGVTVRPILQLMPVGFSRFESGAFTGAEDLLARVRHEDDFPLERPDELILFRMPMSLARPHAWPKAADVDTKLHGARV
jgi:hypothetical protein